MRDGFFNNCFFIIDINFIRNLNQTNKKSLKT